MRVERRVERGDKERSRQTETDDRRTHEQLTAPPSHWRDCHFADALSPSLLKHLTNMEGGAAEWQSRQRLAVLE